MNIKCEYTELIEPHKLIPNPKNPNKHPDEQINMLAKIIDYQGMRSPIVVSKRSGFIIKGHGRLEALKELAWEKVPVDFQDYDSEAQEYEDMVADNAIAEWAAQDLAMINLDIIDLGPELKIEMLGIKDFVLEPVEKYDKQDDVPEIKHNPITKRGDIWLLGEHRVMCGDATSIDDLDKAIGGNIIDYLITDPPYGIDAIKKSGVLSERYEQYKGDENTDCAEDFMQLALSRFDRHIVFGGNYFAHWLPQSTHWIIWDKRGANMEGGNKNGDQSDCEIAWTNLPKRNVKCYKHVWAGWFRAGNKKDELKSKVHPSQKPVGLFEKIFEDYEFKSMFDAFLGSGSTLIACEKTNRKCYGMELDEHYCDVIVERWQNFTGKEAISESGIRYNELKG